MVVVWLASLALAEEEEEEEEEEFIHLQVDAAFSVPHVEVEERIRFEAGHRLGKNVGVDVFTHMSPTYGEVLAGPTFYLKKWAANVSLGFTTSEMPWRGSAFIAREGEVFEFLALVEAGGSEPWFLCHGIRTVHHLTVGFLAQRFDGLGPRLGVTTHGLEIWIAPMYDPEGDDANIVTGLNWTP